MKTPFSLALTLLACLALLGGCARTQTPAAPAAPEPPPVMTWQIDRATLDEGLPVEMYFEIPVFAGGADAAGRINDTLASVRRAYIDGTAADVREMVRDSMGTAFGPTAEMPYTDTHTAAVHTCDASLVSLTIAYEWYMGGVMDYGVDTYTFDAATGAPLTLRDVLDGSDDALRSSIADALAEQYPDIEGEGLTESPLDTVRAMPVESFHFYVADGAVHVAFNKYEITYGAAGAFDVTLPDALKR